MNYVNEQNMQEILDGIAKKIGQGGGSGAGLEDWQASHEYAENDICVYNGQIYKAIVGFESDTTFSTTQILESYTLQSGDVPIVYTQGTDISIDDIVSYDGNYYKALYDFTCGDTFGLYALEEYTPKELTKAQEDEIVQEWNNIIGDRVGIKIPTEVQAVRRILWNGSFNTVDSPLAINDSIENYDAFELYFANNNQDEIGVYTYSTEDINYSKTYQFRIFNGIDENYCYSASSSFFDSTHFRIDALAFKGWTTCYLIKIVGIKYINPNTYSTEEQIVGKWIDGKPIYQITVTIESQSNDTEDYTFSNLGIINISKLINIDAITSLGITNNTYWSTSNMLRIRRGGDNTLEVYAPTQKLNFPCYITLQYTKTTD